MFSFACRNGIEQWQSLKKRYQTAKVFLSNLMSERTDTRTISKVPYGLYGGRYIDIPVTIRQGRAGENGEGWKEFADSALFRAVRCYVFLDGKCSSFT